jgi:hypothetical protein
MVTLNNWKCNLVIYKRIDKIQARGNIDSFKFTDEFDKVGS